MFALRTSYTRWSPPPPSSLLGRGNPTTRAAARQLQHPHHPRGTRSRYGYNGYRRPQYNRFARAQQLHGLWKTSPPFRRGVYAVGGGAGAFYVYHLEEVPVRLSLPSPELHV